MLLCIVALLSIGVVALVTWVYNYNLVKLLRTNRLQTVAYLKAIQVRRAVECLFREVNTIPDRLIIQDYLRNLDSSPLNLTVTQAMAEQDLTVAVMALPKDVREARVSPSIYSKKDILFASADDFTFPDSLYPSTIPVFNQSDPTTYATAIGPISYNGSYYMSFTVPIVDSTNVSFALGYLGVVTSAESIRDVVTDTVDLDVAQQLLGDTVVLALINENDPLSANTSGPGFAHILFSTTNDMAKYQSTPFQPSAYPPAAAAFNNTTSAVIDTTDLLGRTVSAGYAPINTTYGDWVLVVQQDQVQTLAPVFDLRNILLIVLFSTILGILISACFLAHFAVKPIVALRKASEKRDATTDAPVLDGLDVDDDESFVLPRVVPPNRKLFRDEVTDLTETFNKMSKRLTVKYSDLENRVRLRTSELEAQKRVAEEANDAKTLFVANVSHELKTPLNGILGMTAICMQEEDLPKIRRSLGIVYKSGELLLHLLNDLLTFSRNQQAGVITLECKEFVIKDITTQILAIFDKQAAESGIRFGVTISPETILNLTLWGDVHRILQIIINLVSNAIKFTPAGGAVQVRMIKLEDKLSPLANARRSSANSSNASIPKRRRILKALGSTARNDSSSSDPASSLTGSATDQLNVDDKRHRLSIDSISDITNPSSPGRGALFEFEVEDTGPGVSEEVREKIFDPFVQGDAALSKKYRGTGLGLAICQQLAKLMDGEVQLRKSVVGAGSTFVFSVPLPIVRRKQSFSSTQRTMSSNNLGHNNSPAQPVVQQNPSNNPDDSSSISSRSGQSVTSPPRLLGLSVPFFAPNSSDVDTTDNKVRDVSIFPEGKFLSMDEREDPLTTLSQKVRVLVAEDNLVSNIDGKVGLLTIIDQSRGSFADVET